MKLITAFVFLVTVYGSATIHGQTQDTQANVYEALLALSDSVDGIREDVYNYKKEILYQLTSECEEQISPSAPGPVCTTRIGPLSGTNDDDSSEVTCSTDEVMTGCSSHLPGTAHGSRDGEIIRFSDDGRPTCVAFNGNTGTGVRPYARCCKWSDMICYYPNGQISSSADDAVSTTVCDQWFNGNPALPTGCLVYTPWQCLDGARPSSDFMIDITSEQRPFTERACLGQNGGGCGGVTSYAACCSAPNLQCQVKYSQASGVEANDEATVACDSGWTLTGCNVFTYWSNTDGAYIEDDVCHAVTGGDGVYVWAVATCCITE